MENFTYYQICYVNPVTKRKYKTNFIFKNEKDANFFITKVLNETSKEHFKFFVKEITINYYTSIIDLLQNKNENQK